MIEQFVLPKTNYSLVDGIYKIMNDEFKANIALFEERYIPIKKSTVFDDIENYELLPINPSTNFPFEWMMRQEGLSIIKHELINKQNLNVLEVSTFNGWLTHHIHNMGHNTVTVDYFTDEIFGLKSKFKYENNNWCAIQCNVEDLSFLKPVFDVIIFNHAIQFFDDTNKIISQLKTLLKPGGKIFFLGLLFFINSEQKRKEVETYCNNHYQKYGFNIFFSPTKGYLDHIDKSIFISHKIKLVNYKSCFKSNFVARLNKKKALVQFGIYEN